VVDNDIDRLLREVIDDGQALQAPPI
jgi:hypothetical protein